MLPNLHLIGCTLYVSVINNSGNYVLSDDAQQFCSKSLGLFHRRPTAVCVQHICKWGENNHEDANGGKYLQTASFDRVEHE